MMSSPFFMDSTDMAIGVLLFKAMEVVQCVADPSCAMCRGYDVFTILHRFHQHGNWRYDVFSVLHRFHQHGNWQSSFQSNGGRGQVFSSTPCNLLSMSPLSKDYCIRFCQVTGADLRSCVSHGHQLLLPASPHHGPSHKIAHTPYSPYRRRWYPSMRITRPHLYGQQQHATHWGSLSLVKSVRDSTAFLWQNGYRSGDTSGKQSRGHLAAWVLPSWTK